MLAGSRISWFGMVYHPQHIQAKKVKISILLKFDSESKPLFPDRTILYSCSQYHQDQPSTLLLLLYVPASCFPVSSPVKPHGNKLFHPWEMPVYFKFESLIKIFRPHNKDLF